MVLQPMRSLFATARSPSAAHCVRSDVDDAADSAIHLCIDPITCWPQDDIHRETQSEPSRPLVQDDFAAEVRSKGWVSTLRNACNTSCILLPGSVWCLFTHQQRGDFIRSSGINDGLLEVIGPCHPPSIHSRTLKICIFPDPPLSLFAEYFPRPPPSPLAPCLAVCSSPLTAADITLHNRVQGRVCAVLRRILLLQPYPWPHCEECCTSGRTAKVSKVCSSAPCNKPHMPPS